MDSLDERFAVYTAVLFVCSAIGALAGLAAVAVTFGLVVAGIEVAYWLGGVLGAPGQPSA
jgi:hypothetical protein